MKNQDISFYVIIVLSICFLGIIQYLNYQIGTLYFSDTQILNIAEKSYNTGCLDLTKNGDYCKIAARKYRDEMKQVVGLQDNANKN